MMMNSHIAVLILLFTPVLVVGDSHQTDEIEKNRAVLANELIESDLAIVGAGAEHTDEFGNRKIRLSIYCKKLGSGRVKVTLYDDNGIPNSSYSFDIECKSAEVYSIKDVDFYQRSKSYSVDFVHR